MAKAKRIKGLDCNSAADAGMKLVLVTRFEEMCGFRGEALNWADPEGVHSMRVASRRLRGALRDFVPYLRKRGLTSVEKQLKDIADALGEVRDHDVAILALEKIEMHAPPQFSEALKQFIAARKDLRQQARKELKLILKKTSLKELESDFIVGVDKATTAQQRKTERTQSSSFTFLKMAKAIILDRLKELEKLSDGLFKPFDVDALHEMRIAAKRLRYAVEMFQQCWRHSLGTYAKSTARMQSALGELHDCDVWIESLGKDIANARKHKQENHVAALVWLVNHFVKLRTRHLRHAVTRWLEWETQDATNKLRAALHSEQRNAISSAKKHMKHK